MAEAAEDEAGSGSDDDDVEIVPNHKRCKARVWNFFDKTNKRNSNKTVLAKCRTCGDLVTCANTTNMIKHMRRSHPDATFKDARTGEEVCPPPGLH